MVGLKRGVVKLESYQESWKIHFEKEAKHLLSKIGEYTLDIQHIGSTAIPGIVAKPIIDMALAIISLSEVEKIIQPLKEIGFIYRGEQGVPGRHLFVKGGEDCRTHHLHVMEKSTDEWKKHISFRDYLLKHPEEVQNYNVLKQSLAKKYKDDRGKYTEGKSDFILSIVDKAQSSNL